MGMRNARFLVGNKIDLVKERQVLANEAEELANKNGLKYVEISAKTLQNMPKLIAWIVQELFRGYVNFAVDDEGVPFPRYIPSLEVVREVCNITLPSNNDTKEKSKCVIQ